MRAISTIQHSINWLNSELKKEKKALREAQSLLGCTIKNSPSQFNGIDKTDYQLGSAKPSSAGVYERDFAATDESQDEPFCLFDGAKWYLSYPTPERAARAGSISVHQDLPWRGLVTRL